MSLSSLFVNIMAVFYNLALECVALTMLYNLFITMFVLQIKCYLKPGYCKKYLL